MTMLQDWSTGENSVEKIKTDMFSIWRWEMGEKNKQTYIRKKKSSGTDLEVSTNSWENVSSVVYFEVTQL